MVCLFDHDGFVQNKLIMVHPPCPQISVLFQKSELMSIHATKDACGYGSHLEQDLLQGKALSFQNSAVQTSDCNNESHIPNACPHCPFCDLSRRSLAVCAPSECGVRDEHAAEVPD